MKVYLGIILLALVMMPATSFSQSQPDELTLLRQQVAALTERLEKLEAASASSQQVQAELKAQNRETVQVVRDMQGTIGEKVQESVKEEISDQSWASRVSWKGDFRYRYEHIDQEGRSNRDRQRVRARPALTAKVNDTVTVGFGLATGGSDPVSTNQTLGGGGSTKAANIDLAYFDWKSASGIKVSGGKFKNPLHRAGGNALLWDGDWRPEGLVAKYDDKTWFGTLMGTFLESDSRREDELAIAAQLGYRTTVGDGMKLTAGLGYYSIGVQGFAPIFDPEDGFGNSLDDQGRYLFDYNEVELFAELGFSLAERPASLFFDYVKNTDADDFDTGWAIGGKYGKAGARGTWEMGYVYQDLEADAVLGLVTDSDFAGGGTDGRGHKITAGYGLGKGWKLNLTYFITETGGDAEDRGEGTERDYDRLQLDIGFKY